MPRNLNRIESEWKKFENAVIPKDAEAIQRQEMRRAYYAGFIAMLELAQNLPDESGGDDDRAVYILESLELEFADFVTRLGRDT